MSDRLKDLQRQRALAQEQVAWLDREIARETGAVSVPASAPAPTPLAASPAAPAPTSPADELIERYAEKEKPVHDQVKQGCLLYLGIAFGLVGLGVLALFLYHQMK